MILCCDPPPSTNNLFITARGRRIKSPEYRSWITAAGWQFKQCKPSPIKGRVAVSITVPRNNRRDLDNFLKPLLDLIVAHGIIKNDNLVEQILIRWHGAADSRAVISLVAV